MHLIVITRENFLFLHKPQISSFLGSPADCSVRRRDCSALLCSLLRPFPQYNSERSPQKDFASFIVIGFRPVPVKSAFQSTLGGSNNSMGTEYCGYDMRVHARNSYLSVLPTAIFNFSVEWHHWLVFVDRLGVPIGLQDTTLSELTQSLEMPLSILAWQSLCERHLEGVLGDLGVHHGFWTNIIRIIMRTASRGSGHGRQQFNMSIKLDLVTKEEVVMEDIEEGFMGGYDSDPDQASRGVSRSTIEKLERESCFVRDGDECCCICLEKLNGADKAIEIPCSHLFHSRCIVEWLKRNDSCPLCRSKVEVEDPQSS